MIEKQVRYLVLEALRKAYPDGLTLTWLETILNYYRVFTTQRDLRRKVIKYLLEKEYIELIDVELPAFEENVKQLRITPKGLQLLEGKLIDTEVEKV